MDEITSLFGNLARLFAFIGGGITTIAVCYAGILWMTSGGDPQKTSQARTALFAAIGGAVIVGIAFLVPRILGETVVEPVGGTLGGVQQAQDCDGILRSQLVFQTNANNATRFNQLITQIQTTRAEDCAAEVWDPEVVDLTLSTVASSPTGYPTLYAAGTNIPSSCYMPYPGSLPTLAGQGVPDSFKNGATGTPTSHLHPTPRRDSQGNILVHFHKDKPPSDSAPCWFHNGRLGVWVSGP